MNIDGSNPVNLINSNANEEGPAWSPDGKRIAYHSDLGSSLFEEASDIWVMISDGSNQTKLTFRGS